MTGLRGQFGEGAWAWMLDEKEQIATYRRFAGRAGMELDAFLEMLDERPSDYARLRALPDSPVIRAERQLDAMTRTEEGHRNLAGSDSPRLLTLEMAIDWNGVGPEEKDGVLARVVDFGKLRPHLRADIAEAARRLWDHSETRRVELTGRGEGDRWKPIGFVALSDELGRVVRERESVASAARDTPLPSPGVIADDREHGGPVRVDDRERLPSPGELAQDQGVPERPGPGHGNDNGLAR